MKLTSEEKRLKRNAYMRCYRKTFSPEQRAAERFSKRKWDKLHPRKRADEAKAFRTRLKAAVIAGYGGACVCCGEDIPEFLSIDHIEPIRKGYHKGREHFYQLYLRLRRENFPDGYQVLCFNCNHAKGTSSECPHARLHAKRFVLLAGGRF